MRPTGSLHLGHLVGTLENWVRLQDEYDCFFMVADWHALMGEYEHPAVVAKYSVENAIDWISFGLNPERATLFIQSHVVEHLELFTIFSCMTPLGWLERCPTYKEQLREITTRDINTYGFLGYPVLQAADILLYKADKVPVGDDQLPHLELTREIGRRFNSLYAKNVFPEPGALLTSASRLLGTDGRKMSKSYGNTINLSDSADAIMKKIQAMITDPQRIKLADKGHPDICGVYAYYSSFFPEAVPEVRGWCESASLGCTECKKRLGQRLVDKLAPFQEKRRRLEQDPALIRGMLEQGAQKAREAARATMKQVKSLLSL